MQGHLVVFVEEGGWPVNQIQVHVVKSQLLQLLLDCTLRVVILRWVDFSSYEQVFPLYLFLAHNLLKYLSNETFIPIAVGSVDMAVADLHNSVIDGLLIFEQVGAQADQGHLAIVGKVSSRLAINRGFFRYSSVSKFHIEYSYLLKFKNIAFSLNLYIK